LLPYQSSITCCPHDFADAAPVVAAKAATAMARTVASLTVGCFKKGVSEGSRCSIRVYA